MKHFVLFCSLLGLVACQSNADVTPVPLTNEIVGTYQTNSFMNYLCLTLSANQMPTVTLHATDDHTATLIITQSFPKSSVQTIRDVSLIQQPDQSIELRLAGQVIGTIQKGRVFTASGMETQGNLLQLSTSTIDFTGYRP